MSRLLLTSDLHLGHRNICKYRTQFSSAEEHHNTIFENVASNVGKRDTLYLLGDIAFDRYWLEKIKSIKCKYKLLVIGNHDTERGIMMKDLVEVYDDVKSLFTHKNIWISHCPIHPQELRGRFGNIHGHLHNQVVKSQVMDRWYRWVQEDSRYVNTCVEHTDYKPIPFTDIQEKLERL